MTGGSLSSGSVLTVKFTVDTNTPPVLRPRDLCRVASLSPSTLHRLPHFAVWLNAKTLTVVFPTVEESEWPKNMVDNLTVSFATGWLTRGNAFAKVYRDNYCY